MKNLRFIFLPKNQSKGLGNTLQIMLHRLAASAAEFLIAFIITADGGAV